MDCKKLIVILKLHEGNDCLEFDIDDKKKYINLNSEDQSSLRELFYIIVSKLLDEKIQFDIKVDDGYSNELFKDIANEYLKKLNTEILTIYNDIPQELKKQ